MADYEDKLIGPVFPTRTGEAQGGATERQMLDSTQGAAGIRTKLRTNPDGSQTMLRTHNGLPRFYTDKVSEAESSLPRGLCAYPMDGANHLTWSKPCILVWDADELKWATLFYNPPQTSREAPSLPSVNEDFKVTYWADATGNVSLCCANLLFYGKKHSGSAYSSWSYGSASIGNAALPLMPFVGLATVGSNSYKKFTIEQTETRTKLMSGEVELYEHYQQRDYGGETGMRAYNIQIPMSVTTDGIEVLFQSAVANNWGNPGDGDYTSNPNKYYWISRVTLPSLSAVTNASTLPTYGARDVVHDGVRATDDNLDDTVTLTIDVGYFDTSDGGAITGALACRPKDGSGAITDPYNPIYYIPKHNKFIVRPSPYPPSFLWRTHEYRQDTFQKTIHDETKVGHVAKGAGVVEVKIKNDTTIDMIVRADGYSFRADSDTVDGTLWPGLAIACFRGDGNEESNVRRLKNDTNDNIKITAALGDMEIILFEHRGYGGGKAEAKDSQKTCGFTFKAGTLVWFEGEEGTLDKARFFGNSEIRECSTGWDLNPYDGDPIGTEYQAKESVSSWFDQYNPKYNTGGWVPHNSFSPYSGKVGFVGTSRTVVACDVALDFVAYVEATVKSECTFSSPGDSWFIGLTNSQMTTTHAVEFDFVIKYRGVEQKTRLIDYACTKPGPWDRQEVEDWVQWPWVWSMPSKLYTVGPPRIFPDVSKHRHTDTVFLHQGVCQDFAGIPQGENPLIPDGEIIFAKRFRLVDVGAEWILGDYLINEGKRGVTDGPESLPYYYCPELKQKVETDWYQIEFDQTGLRAWVGDIKTRTTINIAEKENRSAVCYRV